MYIGEPYMATPNGYLMPVDPQQMCQVHYYYPSNFYPPHVVPDEGLMPIDVPPPSPYFRDYSVPYYTTPQTYSKRPIKSRFSRLHEDEKRQLAKTLANEKCVSKKTSDGDDSGVSELEDQNCSATRLLYEEPKPSQEFEIEIMATVDDKKPNCQKVTKPQKQKKKDAKKKVKKVKEPKVLKNVIEIQEPDFSSFSGGLLPFKSEVTPKVETKKSSVTSKKSNKNQKKTVLTQSEASSKEREKNTKKSQKNKRTSKNVSPNLLTSEEVEISRQCDISPKNEEIPNKNQTPDHSEVNWFTNKEKRTKSPKNNPSAPLNPTQLTQETIHTSASNSCLSSIVNSIEPSQSPSDSNVLSNIVIEKSSRRTELKSNTAKSTKKQTKKRELISPYSSNCEMANTKTELLAFEENVSNLVLTKLSENDVSSSFVVVSETTEIEDISEVDSKPMATEKIISIDSKPKDTKEIILKLDSKPKDSEIDSKRRTTKEFVSKLDSKTKASEGVLIKVDISLCSQTAIFEGNKDSVNEEILTSPSVVVVNEENKGEVEVNTYMTELKSDSLSLNTDHINNNLIEQEKKEGSTLPNSLESSDSLPRRFSELGVTEAVTKWVESVTPEKAFLIPLATTMNKENSISESLVNSSDDEQIRDHCSSGRSSSRKSSSLESTPKNVPDNSSNILIDKKNSSGDYNSKRDLSSTPNRVRRRSRQPRKLRRSSKPSDSSLSPLNDSPSKSKLVSAKTQQDSSSPYLPSDIQASDHFLCSPPEVRELPFSSEGRFYSNPLNQFISLTSEAKPLTLPLSSSTSQVPRVVSPVLINRSRSPAASTSSRLSPDPLISNSTSSSLVNLDSRLHSSCQTKTELASSDPLPLCSLM